jgi:transcriptional regulator with XRE-family HTH domain
MALFFDTAWFDARLRALGLSRTVVASALGVTEAELGEIWKDQRELRAGQVSVLAALLQETPETIADRAGISTPVPDSLPTLSALERRLERIEAALETLTALVRAQSK